MLLVFRVPHRRAGALSLRSSVAICIVLWKPGGRKEVESRLTTIDPDCCFDLNACW